MREILFRGKTEDGRWENGYLVKGTYDFNNEELTAIIPVDVTFGEYGISDSHEVIPETVGQFTGLFDENGIAIFEGDIMKLLVGYDEDEIPKYGVVRWDNESCGFEPFSDSIENCGHCGGGYNSKHCEIIGNIHDNPELLEVLKCSR